LCDGPTLSWGCTRLVPKTPGEETPPNTDKYLRRGAQLSLSVAVLDASTVLAPAVVKLIGLAKSLAGKKKPQPINAWALTSSGAAHL
jgi:hypothetical protein